MSQLGRLGRKATPLLQELERCAPGAMQQFSSAAEAPAGRGMGRGAAAGPGSSPGAPGSGHRGPAGRGRGGPRRDGGEGPQGARRPQRQHGGEGGGGDRRGQRRDGSRPPARYGGGGGGFGGDDGGSFDVTDVPRHLNDAPYEILTRFEYAIRDAANPELPAVPLRDIPMDINDLANTDNLALAKYYVSPRDWQAFCAGDMDEDEQNDLADKLAASLLADDRYRAKQANVQAAINADPDYDLAASISSRPQLRGSRRGDALPSAQALAAELESQKAALMAQYSMSEEEWAAAKAATVQQQLADARVAAAPALPNHLAHERRLLALLDKSLPKDHPNYQAAKQRLEVLQGNPGWSQERKVVFAKRLIKRLASTTA